MFWILFDFQLYSVVHRLKLYYNDRLSATSILLKVKSIWASSTAIIDCFAPCSMFYCSKRKVCWEEIHSSSGSTVKGKGIGLLSNQELKVHSSPFCVCAGFCLHSFHHNTSTESLKVQLCTV